MKFKDRTEREKFKRQFRDALIYNLSYLRIDAKRIADNWDKYRLFDDIDIQSVADAVNAVKAVDDTEPDNLERHIRSLYGDN